MLVNQIKRKNCPHVITILFQVTLHSKRVDDITIEIHNKASSWFQNTNVNSRLLQRSTKKITTSIKTQANWSYVITTTCYLLHFFDSSFTDGVFVLRRGLRRSAFTGNEARLFEDIFLVRWWGDRGKLSPCENSSYKESIDVDERDLFSEETGKQAEILLINFSCFAWRFPGLRNECLFHASAGNPIMRCSIDDFVDLPLGRFPYAVS